MKNTSLKIYKLLSHTKKYGIKSSVKKAVSYYKRKSDYKNLKVGIVSINIHTKVLNFASPLHSYAFQQFLFKNKIDNVVIDYLPSYYGRFDPKHPYDYYLEHPIENTKKQERAIHIWKELYKEREIRYEKFEDFIKKYFIKTPVVYTQNKLDNECPECDIFICATDIIWEHHKKNGFDRGFFLNCESLKDKPKIAYAASRGANKYTKKDRKEFFSIIKDFNYVSVREKKYCNYINSSKNRRASLVLDPVFLMNKRFYKKLSLPPKKTNYVLVYTVMQDATELLIMAGKFAKEHNLELIELSEEVDNKNVPYAHDIIYDIGIEEWLGYIINAEYIFTNSFHCTCFSIIFNKQFFVGDRKGDKLDNIIELFHLKNRKINADYGLTNDKIDYKQTNKLMKQYIKVSKDYILGAINQIKNGTQRSINGIEKYLYE